MPAISVVVPTYDRADRLERLLGALGEQVPVPGGFEVIVVDDGSTDRTADVVGSHPGVRYEQQANAGPAAARNRGWRAALAPLVAFTDDDAVPSPAWLRDLLAAAEQGYEGVGGRIVPLVPGFLADFVGLERHVGHGVDDDGSVRYLVTANCGWRREVLEELDGFDESFQRASGEDTDFTLRARTAGKHLVVLDDAVVAHDHRTSLPAVLRTYHKHGRTRDRVVAANPDFAWGARRRAMLGPAYWFGRYRYYRTEVGPLRAVAYVGLRVVGLVWYAAGVLQSSRVP